MKLYIYIYIITYIKTHNQIFYHLILPLKVLTIFELSSMSDFLKYC